MKIPTFLYSHDIKLDLFFFRTGYSVILCWKRASRFCESQVQHFGSQSINSCHLCCSLHLLFQPILWQGFLGFPTLLCSGLLFHLPLELSSLKKDCSTIPWLSKLCVQKWGKGDSFRTTLEMVSSMSCLPWVNLSLCQASSVLCEHFLPLNKTENPTLYVGFLGFRHFRNSLSNIWEDILCRIHYYGYMLLVRTPSSASENVL